MEIASKKCKPWFMSGTLTLKECKKKKRIITMYIIINIVLNFPWEVVKHFFGCTCSQCFLIFPLNAVR